MRRRTFLLTAPGAVAAQQTTRVTGYEVWSWDRWRKITGENRRQIVSDQTGKAGLADLLAFNGQRITASGDWPARRRSILGVIQAILGPSPATRPPLETRTLEETPLEGYIRRRVMYQSEPGEFVPAFLLVPRKLDAPAPAVICPHQTVQEGKNEPAGLAGNSRLHMALHLVRRGFVTLAYDAACFGERHDPASGHYGDAIPFYKKHPEWSMMGKMAWDLSRGVDYLRSLDFVDPASIGSIGHSHGGYTTLFGMALDDRIAAGASSCGFDTFRHDGNVFRWSHATALMPRLGFYLSSPYVDMRFYSGVLDSETIQTPLDMHYVLAMIAPRPLFLSTSDEDSVFPNAGWSARQALARLEPVYRLLGAEDRMGSYYFRGGHGFPPEAAERAYGWLERWLRR
jgi:dienelactone hydrolase